LLLALVGTNGFDEKNPWKDGKKLLTKPGKLLEDLVSIDITALKKSDVKKIRNIMNNEDMSAEALMNVYQACGHLA
jgi:hypothetical protein